jgi:crotonobetainyl-CoA:carnitine CoA-transferase CaiB-like acyl-CoA transferase
MELPEIANHPHVAEREMVVSVTSGDESFLLPGSPLKLSETPGRVHRPAEALGASNDYVFRELLGRSEEEIRRLKADGVTD